MGIETVQESRCFGGIQGTYRHQSAETGCAMQFSVFTPPHDTGAKLPAVYYLSGLTCTEENFTVKAGAQRVASELGLIVIAPDTSPRGLDLPGEDDSYDFGSGAGFYVDATEAPWATNYRMYSYVTRELPDLVEARFPADGDRRGIFGHSMGGHGALVCAIRNPDRYRSVSAFAPIANPSQCPWGRKAFTGYLGTQPQRWREYDATELVRERGWRSRILIDQGDTDQFLDEQLLPNNFAEACRSQGVDLNLRMQAGYDHSYFFIATFVGDHLSHHASLLAA